MHFDEALKQKWHEDLKLAAKTAQTDTVAEDAAVPVEPKETTEDAMDVDTEPNETAVTE